MVNFPGSLDSLSNPTPSTRLTDSGFEHSTQHSNLNDIAELTEKILVGPLIFNVKGYGAVGDGTANDRAAIQSAINAQQAAGGVVYVPAGTYKIGAVGDVQGLYLAPGATTDATKACVIQGAGMHNTILKQGIDLGISSGIIGYGSGGGNNPKQAQMVVSDLTFDGNYSGVDSGALAQGLGTLVAALVPYTAGGASVAHDGLYHHFERVRFYRPNSYVFQPSNSVELIGCVFDQVGQPDIASGGLHLDNLGSGDWTDAIVIGCSWTDSSGNYVDFEAAAGKPCRLTFIGNTSENHQIGGVYGAGKYSVIMGNNLQNVNTGSGIGYDLNTVDKSNNICAFNTLTKLNVNGSNLSAANGDIVFGNVSEDTNPVNNMVGNLLVRRSASGQDSDIRFTNEAGTVRGRIRFTGSSEEMKIYTDDTQRLSIENAGRFVFADGVHFSLGSSGGTKIGDDPAQKIGFWNKAPAVQPAAVADATDAATAITQLNALLARLRTIGIIAT